jgi:hypothetical protein
MGYFRIQGFRVRMLIVPQFSRLGQKAMGVLVEGNHQWFSQIQSTRQ